MSDNVRFHSKHHAKAHHTKGTPGYIDSAKDPLAGPGNEFQGDFHLSGCFVVYDTEVPDTSGKLCISTLNQVDSQYTTIQDNSAAWNQGSKWTDLNGSTYLTQLGDNVLMRTTSPVTDGLTVSGGIATYSQFLSSRDGGQTFIDLAGLFGDRYTFNISPSAPTVSEVFTGDGSTTLFESACAIDSTSRILVNIGGVAQLPTTHYTVSANPTRNNKADIKILPAVASNVPIEVRHFPSSNSPWTFNTDGATIYYTQGNVGIGTQSPSKRLTVAGEVSASGALIVGGDLEIGRVASPWIDGGSSIYYNNGNVGIGTTTPDQLFHVKGASNQIRIEDSTDNQKWDISADAGDFNIFDATNNKIPFAIDANTPTGTFVIKSTGNVGIGTAAPSVPLHISKDTADLFQVERPSINKWTFRVTHGGLGIDDNSLIIKPTTTASDFAIKTTTADSGSPDFVINEEGNVGIGEPAPAHKLTVVSANDDFYDAVAGFYTNNKSVGVQIHNQGVGIASQAADGSTPLDANTNFRIDARGTGSVIINTQGGTDVGIGTEAPSHLLHVNGNIGTGTYGTVSTGAGFRISGTEIYGQTSATDKVKISATTGDSWFLNNVGIGTDSPSYALHVATNTGYLAYFQNTSTTDYRPIAFTDDENIVRGSIGVNTTTNDFHLADASGVSMTLNSGNVGIGMNNPSVALDVSGSIEYTGTISDVSDDRLKENKTLLSDCLNKISSLNGYTYNLISDEDNELEIGLIAQDVLSVFPEAVKVHEQDEDGNDLYGLSYTQLIAPMIEAIKELKVQNELMRARIEQLESN